MIRILVGVKWCLEVNADRRFAIKNMNGDLGKYFNYTYTKEEGEVC